MSGNEVNLNLNYINIPLIFQYMYDNGFRLQAGPQLGVLVSAKSKTNNSESDVKDDFESIDLRNWSWCELCKPCYGLWRSMPDITTD
jgi:hypothetical protein